jgi:flagellar biosynthetic protein FliQ
MGPDMVVELSRHLLMEALLMAAPVLIAAALISLLLSLAQTLTGIQETTLTSVPRLMTVAVVIIACLPWFLRRLTTYTLDLWHDLHRYLG